MDEGWGNRSTLKRTVVTEVLKDALRWIPPVERKQPQGR